uniref:hypothetical protein n=1 Tax=Ningiella ruwaisensis TaxID=2364274 RepID=UPI0010A0B4AB|nr:hypothetical protein [Ningiella ruwaisensis]
MSTNFSGNEEVTIIYEYRPTTETNNLFLNGKADTENGKTLRTCFEFDAYGNQIGEIAPKANLSRYF